jgi:hypothetical protein
MKKIFYAFLVLLFIGLDFSANAQQLINSQFIGNRSKNYLQNLYGPLIQNGVKLYKVTYETLDIHGALDTASGLFVLPDREVSFTYPILCYQHGTVNGPNDVPSNLAGGSALPMIFAGLGYATSAADYLGLGEARGFHPYVHAKSEASAAIDMLFAIRQLDDEDDELFLNDQLFITGYSQGGHGAAAVHKEIQEFYSEDFTVTASAPMSGPYNISETMTESILNEAVYYYPGYVAYTILSFNLASDLGYEVEDLFKAPYVPAITQFYTGQIELPSLHSNLISLLTTNEGASVPKFMIKDEILDIVVNEPDHALNEAFRVNDVFDWIPEAPTRLFYCTADDQVLYLNSVVADSVMNANGALDVMAIDVDPTADHGGCVNPAVVQTLLFFANYQQLTVDNEDFVLQGNIKLTPNPARENVKLENIPEGALIEIFDLKGSLKQQLKSTGDSPSINVSALSTGIYLLRVTKGSQVFHSKLFKD